MYNFAKVLFHHDTRALRSNPPPPQSEQQLSLRPRRPPSTPFTTPSPSWQLKHRIEKGSVVPFNIVVYGNYGN